MTELERKVLDAAREWLVERAPRDSAERTLMAALARAYPGDLHCRETCDCGDTYCDECPTAAQNESCIVKWEQEAAALALKTA